MNNNNKDKAVNYQPDISIIIPMYNEEEKISSFFSLILPFLQNINLSWELLLIDDGSLDQTVKQFNILNSNPSQIKLISYKDNMGRGFALRQGFEACKGRYVITTEFDLSYGTNIITSLYDHLIASNYDIVIASPYREGGKTVNIPFKRKFLSLFGNKVLKLTNLPNITTFTGMSRGYNGDFIRTLFLEENGKEIHLEILFKSMILKANIDEIPATLTWTRNKQAPKSATRSFKAFHIIRTHLSYLFNESPFLLFGTIGLMILLMGICIGLFLFMDFFVLHNTIGNQIVLILSTMLLILSGMQIFLFCFLSYQNLMTKKEVFKILQFITASKKNTDLLK